MSLPAMGLYPSSDPRGSLQLHQKASHPEAITEQENEIAILSWACCRVFLSHIIG
ncbi:hypothetical protein PISMIDRAFT_690785 [Pisolithus microcarpus 441]|uniref:Uncharacterized protein n=1 Tax=Pisolithus microcarpus 441 TaxID=765257 RepID=A0A0C9Y0I3_9AGAM|nr:hypothetical protein PISMIDRAFT_690785 [Pisolithus microcarpus 441]